jgi:WD40 repeat protein
MGRRNSNLSRSIQSPRYGCQHCIFASGKSDRLWMLGQLDAIVGCGERIISTSVNRPYRDFERCRVSPQGYQVISASEDTAVRLWDTVTGECTGVLNGHTSGVYCVASSPNGKLIASGSKDSTIRLWDVASLKCRQILEGHTGWVRLTLFSPQGDTLVTGDEDFTIRLWDPESGEWKRTITGHKSAVICIA